MEQTGKVIIFDNEDDAKTWFETIKEVKFASKVNSAWESYYIRLREAEVNIYPKKKE